MIAELPLINLAVTEIKRNMAETKKAVFNLVSKSNWFCIAA